MRRRVAIVALALLAMTAAPSATAAADAAPRKMLPKLCLGQGILGAGVCVPAPF